MELSAGEKLSGHRALSGIYIALVSFYVRGNSGVLSANWIVEYAILTKICCSDKSMLTAYRFSLPMVYHKSVTKEEVPETARIGRKAK